MIKKILFSLLVFFIVYGNTYAQENNLQKFQKKPPALSSHFPARQPDAIQGDEFMEKIKNLPLTERESMIFTEIKEGNMPSFCAKFKTIELFNGNDTCKVQVALDYLAIGSDTNFCRIPVSPELAQKIADFAGCSLPTTKIVDAIWQNADVKIQPITHAPAGNINERVEMFILHNDEIEQALKSINKPFDRDTSILDGLKKDIVITNKLLKNPGKVAIYGWYKLDGSFWQPLYTGHINTYMDYSHGLRLIDDTVTINNIPYTVRDVLSNSAYYKLLSDETGIMEQPYYLYGSIQVPEPPVSWGIKNEGNNSVKILLHKGKNSDASEIYISLNGKDFDKETITTKTEYSLSRIEPEKRIYIKLKGTNGSDFSYFSETLTIVPTENRSKMLIVQGFDRPSDGNSYDFMKYHAESASNMQLEFDVATNEAVKDKLFDLKSYKYINYVLGDESTADETFDKNEQILVKEYLQFGGNLLVSGSEIAWDLDYKGNTSDKNFYHSFLKSKYQHDAPENISAKYYSVHGVEGSFFEDIPELMFDDGSHGTIHVKYPDDIIAINGGEPVLHYFETKSTAYAAIAYSGFFPEGVTKGKIVNLGFPLETIYQEESRTLLFEKIIEYFKQETTSISQNNNQSIFSVYPNPAKNEIHVTLKEKHKNAKLEIFDLTGKLQHKIQTSNHSASNTISINTSQLKNGMYICVLQTSSIKITQKIVIQKN